MGKEKDKSNKTDLPAAAEETGAGSLPAGEGPGLSPGGSAPNPAGGGAGAAPAPDPTRAGAPPLDPGDVTAPPTTRLSAQTVGGADAAEADAKGEEKKTDQAAEAGAEEKEALKTVGQWIMEKRLAGWQAAALLRAKGWTEDKRVSADEFHEALRRLMSRSQGARAK